MTGFDYNNGKKVQVEKVRFYGLFMQFLFINDPDIATINGKTYLNTKPHLKLFK
jgi:hypothetical protein